MNELKKILKILLALMLFILVMAMPFELERSQHTFLAIFSMVAFLWLFSEIPLFVSGLIGVTLSVVFGIVSVKAAFAPFADPIIFLFLGGFLLARALELTSLDQYLARKVLAHPWSNRSPKRMILSFYSLSFVLSMWISNTAAMALLLPVSYGVIMRLENQFEMKDSSLGEKLVLGLAYCATIGGNATPIGSPPNVIAIGLLRELTGERVGFVQWMLICGPIALALFAVVFYLTTKHIQGPGPSSGPEHPSINEGKITSRQRWVMGIFFLTVSLWIAPSLLQLIVSENSEFGSFLANALAPSVVATGCTSLLFIAPFHSSQKLLSAQDLAQLDWSSLLLFGSGLSLGKILFDSGLATVFAETLGRGAPFFGLPVLISLLLLITIFFTELASNTATANILIPIVIALGQSLGSDSIFPPILIALACNSAFMLPVATPPNAIAYGSKRIHKMTMIKEGFALNIAAWLLLAVVAMLVLL